MMSVPIWLFVLMIILAVPIALLLVLILIASIIIWISDALEERELKKCNNTKKQKHK